MPSRNSSLKGCYVTSGDDATSHTIIVRLAGGLGNQMFQYAAARALAKRLGADLELDLSWFDEIKPGRARRAFCLDRFGICEPRATPAKIRRYRGYTLYGRAVRKIFGRDVRTNVRRVETPQEYGNLQALRRLRGIYLHGYWQSERFFEDAKDEVRNAFAAPQRSPSAGYAMRRVLEESNSLALHIRRGDYAADSKLRAKFGTCSVAYYERCLADARHSLGRFKVFLFSEDIAWATQNLRLPPDVVAVSPQGDDEGLVSFDLMRRCKHFIISNSSFSWWAAWLGETANTLTFAPTPWFAGGLDDGGIVPERWIRVAAAP